MSASKEIKTAWKDGVWYSNSMRQYFIVVKGSEANWRKMSSLDFPESKPFMVGEWNYGEFGQANPEVANASGQENYNVEITLDLLKTTKAKK